MGCVLLKTDTKNLKPEVARPEKKQTLVHDYIAAAVIIFIFSQKHAGFMLAFVMLLSLPFLVFNIVVMIKNPDRRRFLRNKILLWIGAFACVIAWHGYLHISSRKIADEVVSMVQQYTAKNGHCPESLADLGLPEDWLKSRLGFSDYRCKEGQPHLYYATTYIVFDTEHYDFMNHTWIHLDD